MAFSKGSAIARYKAAARKIKRDRKACGVTWTDPQRKPRTPSYVICPNRDGTFYVADLNADPQRYFHGVAQVATGFDSREEAQSWIDAQ